MTTIKELLHAPEFQHLQLIAGENGLNRKLTGINVIESNDFISFCRPHELIITTGIQAKDNPTQLEELVRLSYSSKVSGIIINIGPYIPRITKSIVQFANEHHFPIFLMEWKYRVADLIKNTFELLSLSKPSYPQEDESRLLYQLIFRYDSPRIEMEKQLTRLGIPTGAELGVIVCTAKAFTHSITQYTDILFQAFQHRYHHFLSLKHNNEWIFLIHKKDIKTPQIPFSKTTEKIYAQAAEQIEDAQLLIGMGNFYTSLRDVAKSYDEAMTVIHLIKQHPQPTIQKYKEIGTYKLLMQIADQSTIKKFHQDILGPLYFYDHLHNTDFVAFLRIYLEENGSTSKISKRLFIHRNTVMYKAHKIEALLDLDLNNMFARTNLNVAFMIEDLLH